MFSENRLSTTNLPSAIVGARSKTVNDVVDYEDGGIGLNDPSAGLLYQEWICETDGTLVTLRSANTAKTTIYTGTDISLVSCTFDQNMAPVLAFVDEDVAKLRWYDSTIADYRVDNISGAFPRVFLDDKRPEFMVSSDVILAYTRDSKLYFAMQRDRYGTEYLLLT
jgi:hypothetical protein